jgi:hypothetical protein
MGFLPKRVFIVGMGDERWKMEDGEASASDSVPSSIFDLPSS